VKTSLDGEDSAQLDVRWECQRSMKGDDGGITAAVFRYGREGRHSEGFTREVGGTYTGRLPSLECCLEREFSFFINDVECTEAILDALRNDKREANINLSLPLSPVKVTLVGSQARIPQGCEVLLERLETNGTWKRLGIEPVNEMGVAEFLARPGEHVRARLVERLKLHNEGPGIIVQSGGDNEISLELYTLREVSGRITYPENFPAGLRSRSKLDVRMTASTKLVGGGFVSVSESGAFRISGFTQLGETWHLTPIAGQVSGRPTQVQSTCEGLELTFPEVYISCIQVVDNSGQPIPFARFQQKGVRGILSSASDQGGKVSFFTARDEQPIGAWIWKPGFVPNEVEFSAGTVIANVVLAPSRKVELMPDRAVRSIFIIGRPSWWPLVANAKEGAPGTWILDSVPIEEFRIRVTLQDGENQIHKIPSKLSYQALALDNQFED